MVKKFKALIIYLQTLKKTQSQFMHGYKIIDADILQEMFSFCSKYVHFGGEKCLCIFQQDKSGRGLSETKICPMSTMKPNIENILY